MSGSNLAGLYEVTFASGGMPRLFVALRSFDCPVDRCNFAADAGVYVLDETHLVLYGAAHWLLDGGTRYAFIEFAAP